MKRKLAALMILAIILTTSFNPKALGLDGKSYYKYIRVALTSAENTMLKITLNGSYTVNELVLSDTVVNLTTDGLKVIYDGQAFDSLEFVPENEANTIGIEMNSGTETRKYQGTMKFTINNGKIRPLNTLFIEDYVKSVVGSEIGPYKFGAEARKAQAIATRTYVLYKQKLNALKDYDVNDTTSFQVYYGYRDVSKFSYMSGINEAVDSTRGLILNHNRSLIEAFFSSSNEGYKEASENVWNSELGYAKAKQDTYSVTNWPNMVWYAVTRITDGKLTAKSSLIEEKLKANKILQPGDSFMNIKLDEITYYESGRVSNITVVYRNLYGTVVEKSFSKEGARSFLSLPSSLYTVSYNSVSDEYTFTGYGFGHGIGLSQWGAEARAKDGQAYTDILKFYYDDSYLATYNIINPEEGWNSSEGNWYYYKNGIMKTSWLLWGGSWYYLRSTGEMATDWVYYGGRWYYLENSGIMKIGWVLYNDNWYYLEDSGAMKTGWLLYGNIWYYLTDGGEMKTGWQWYSGNWYYLGSDGGMKTGWVHDGYNWYYLYEDGRMAHDTVIGGYRLASNGVWIP